MVTAPGVVIMASKGIFELLKQDHREVEDLMRRIENAEDEQTCMALFAELKTALLAHSQAEDEVLYSRLDEDEVTEALIGEARDEHQGVEDLLEELGEIEDDDDWMERFQDLKQSVQHHVSEEEGELFAAARKVLGDDEIEELGTEFAEIKEEELEGMQPGSQEEVRR
jgi:hemerythrin superfamily protein